MGWYFSHNCNSFWNIKTVPVSVRWIIINPKDHIAKWYSWDSNLVKLQGLYSQPLGLYWRRQWQPTPVLLPGKSHGRKSLVGCSPWRCKELDQTEQLRFYFSLSWLEKEMATHSSVLENPRDGGAWWAAIYGVARSRTRLKQLSSSSSRTILPHGFKNY